jgi:hypothetical protein
MTKLNRKIMRNKNITVLAKDNRLVGAIQELNLEELEHVAGGDDYIVYIQKPGH